MKRNVALIIFNDESEDKEKLQIITNTFYRMDMTLAVLINKTSKEIQEAVETLSQMEPSEILDILFVIHGKQVQNSDRKFVTKDGILDLYDDIIQPLLCTPGFEEKKKIVFTSGIEYHMTSVQYDDSRWPTSHGENVYTVSSKKENFINEIFPKLITKRGNLTNAVYDCKHLVFKEMITTGDIVLSMPQPSSADAAEGHKYVLG